jgi:hypothetical protein
MKTQIPSSRFILSLAGIFFFLVLFCGKASALNVVNYTFSATAGTFSQVQGIPGAVSPALSGGNIDDGYYNSKPIGFTFNYEGQNYTTFSASTNGWLTLGNTISVSATANNLTSGTPRPLIAPLWDDIAQNVAGDFTYYVSGTFPSRILTVEWLNMKWQYNATAPGISFQVKLYEANKRVEFIYRQETGTTATPTASIGIAGLTSGIFLSLNATSASPAASSATETITLASKPATGQVYRFDPYIIQPVISAVTPLVGPINTTVNISGTNFETTTTNNYVYFGATKANIISASSTALSVSVPNGASYYPLSVTTSTQFRTETAPLAFDVTFNCGGFINSTSFAPKVDFTITGFDRDLAICDVDGDGKADIGACSDANSGTIVFLRNITTNGVINSSSFSAPYYLSPALSPGHITFDDVDGDGKKDMIFGEYNLPSVYDSVVVYRNTGTAGIINASTFSQRTAFRASGYPNPKMCDIDGDGKPEMLIASQQANLVEVKQNLSTAGTFNTSSLAASVTFATNGSPIDIQTADLDGDDKNDVALVNSGTTSMSVFRNTSTTGVINTSSFAARMDFTTFTSPSDMFIADFDNDGKPDIIVSCAVTTGSCVSVFRNTSTPGTISFAARVDIATPANPSSLAVTDFDGDGKPDFAVTCSGSTQAAFFKNTSSVGSISFTNSASFLTGPNTFSLAGVDMDGDSKPELIAVSNQSSTATHNISVLQNTITPLNVIAPAAVSGSTSYCDNNTWKTYYDPANPTQVLAAIKDNGNNLGTTTVTEYKDAAPGNYNGNRFLARHFKITPTTQPSTSVQVRLYFTNAEFTALQAVDPSLISAANLSVTKYDGPTEDGTYNPTDATSLVWYSQASITNGTAYGGKYLEFTISSFSEFWIHSGAGVLPIELLTFNATPENDNVLLNWSTASETNNDFFTIEKTKDGLTFETVAILNGAGNSTQLNNYHCIDQHPYEGVSYYRLKQTDFNGQFTYSEFKSVEYFSEENLFSVFPNPGNGIINVVCPGSKDELVMLEIIDNMGRIVRHEELTIGELEQHALNLQQGVFSLLVTRGSTRFVRQIVIL